MSAVSSRIGSVAPQKSPRSSLRASKEPTDRDRRDRRPRRVALRVLAVATLDATAPQLRRNRAMIRG
jgi:hypothetical protein